MEEILRILMNLIRIGVVNSINPSNGSVKVLFQDKDDLVSAELPLFDREYYMPEVGKQVVCVFLPNGIQQGFCLGTFFSKLNPPPAQNSELYVKDFGDGTKITYNKTTKTITIDAANPITINGDVNINGNITADNLGV